MKFTSTLQENGKFKYIMETEKLMEISSMQVAVKDYIKFIKKQGWQEDKTFQELYDSLNNVDEALSSCNK